MALSGVSIIGGVLMICVGIDIAKSTHYAAVMDYGGAVLVEPFAFDRRSQIYITAEKGLMLS